MLVTKWLAFGINTLPADALAPKVAKASPGNKCCCLTDIFYLKSESIQDTNQNENITL